MPQLQYTPARVRKTEVSKANMNQSGYNTHPPGYGNTGIANSLLAQCCYNTHPPGCSLIRLEIHHLEKKLFNPFYLHIKKLLISLRLSLPWMTDHILGSKKAGITIL